MQADSKQTTILVLTVAAFGFLGWQIYGLVRSSNDYNIPDTVRNTTEVSHGPEPTASTPLITANSAEMKQPHLSNISATASASQPAPVPSGQVQSVPLKARKPQSSAPQVSNLVERPVPKNQKQYVQLVNQYEIAKMQRQLLDEQVGIASAQARIATLNHQVVKLGRTQPAPIQHAAPLPRIAQVVAPMAAPVTQENITLSYLDNQSGHWTATINQDGSYVTVKPNQTLSEHTKVLSITQNGVVLDENHQKVLISFSGRKVLKEETPKMIVKATVSATPNPTTITAPTPPSASTATSQPAVTPEPATTKPEGANPLAAAVEKNQTSIEQATPQAQTQPSAPTTNDPAQKPNTETMNVASKNPESPKAQETTATPQSAKVEAPGTLLVTPHGTTEIGGASVTSAATPTKPTNAASTASPDTDSSKNGNLAAPSAESVNPSSPNPSAKINTAANAPHDKAWFLAHIQSKPVMHPNQSVGYANVMPSNAKISTGDAKLVMDQRKNGQAEPSLVVSHLANPPGQLKLSPAQRHSYSELEGYIASKSLNHRPHFSDAEKVLLKTPGKYYTLQFMGSHDVNEIKDFIKDNHLGEQASYYHTYYLGQDWYVLTYGSYPTEQSAARAYQSLPKQLNDMQPWIRRMEGIHHAILRQHA